MKIIVKILFVEFFIVSLAYLFIFFYLLNFSSLIIFLFCLCCLLYLFYDEDFNFNKHLKSTEQKYEIRTSRSRIDKIDCDNEFDLKLWAKSKISKIKKRIIDLHNFFIRTEQRFYDLDDPEYKKVEDIKEKEKPNTRNKLSTIEK